MPFQIIRNDITRVRADAIVNTANPNPVYGSGTDTAVYRAAGEKRLLAARRKIGPIAPGEAAVTKAFALPARYILTGPVMIMAVRMAAVSTAARIINNFFCLLFIIDVPSGVTHEFCRMLQSVPRSRYYQYITESSIIMYFGAACPKLYALGKET